MKNTSVIPVTGTLLLLAVILLSPVSAFADVYPGNLTFTTQAQVDTFDARWTEISGYLSINGGDITNLSRLQNLTTISGNLNINFCNSLTTSHGMEGIKLIKGGLNCSYNPILSSLQGLNGLTAIQSYAVIQYNAQLGSLSGLENLNSIGGSFLIYYNKILASIAGLRHLQSVGGYLMISENYALTNLDGLDALQTFEGTLRIIANPALLNIDALKLISRVSDLQIIYNGSLTNLDGLSNLTNAGSLVKIVNNTSLARCCGLYAALASGNTPLSAINISLNGANCTYDDILANGPCEKPMVIALQFKDQNGSAVGGVLARLTMPGKADVKTQSQYEISQLWGQYPFNALFQGTRPPTGGLYKLHFSAPEGWRFAGPDSMDIQAPEDEPLYSVTGNAFLLERIDGSQTPSTPPQPVCSDEHKTPDALTFVTGSPSFASESWCNAVDGVTFGRAGTATVWPDDSGFAWAIFRFVDNGVYQFNRLYTVTGHDEANERIDRRATKIEVLVSTTGAAPADFSSLGVFNIKKTTLVWHKLGQEIKAKYVMLRILEPVWSSHNTRQIVEFGVSENKTGHAVPASQGADLAALPEETALIGVYPNPFNPVTAISYNLAETAPVKLCIFNVTGEIVATLVDGQQQAGGYSLSWNAAHLPTGVYFCQLQAGDYRTTQRLVLVK